MSTSKATAFDLSTLRKLIEASPSEEIALRVSAQLPVVTRIEIDQELLARMEAGSPTLPERLAQLLHPQVESLTRSELRDLIDPATVKVLDAADAVSDKPMAIIDAPVAAPPDGAEAQQQHAWSLSSRLASLDASIYPSDVATLIREAQELHPRMAPQTGGRMRGG